MEYYECVYVIDLKLIVCNVNYGVNCSEINKRYVVVNINYLLYVYVL